MIREVIHRCDEFEQEMIVACYWDQFKPQLTAQKLFYLFGVLQATKTISHKTAEARSRLEANLRERGF